MSFLKELAQKVLSVLECPARSSERLETSEGDTEDGQNLHPEIIPDPNTSQRELTSDLTTDPDSGICEIPEIQEPVAGVIETLIPARKPHMSDFDTSKRIGAGAYGAVYLVRHKDSQQIFAMKKMPKWKLNTPSSEDSAFLERDILTFADCPFVVSMLCSFPTKSYLCMVMEYAEGGDCRTLLNTKGHLSVPLARLYFAEAVLAVQYLHSYGIVHRDLKPENLLITSAGHIKVTDFGLTKLGVMMPKTNIYKQLTGDITREFLDYQVCGTAYYIAPEVILEKGYGRPVDWWSMGIILHEFLMGKVPFYGQSNSEIDENIVSGDVVWSNYNRIPPFDAQNLVTNLLIKDPAYRLGTEGAFEIKWHPFLSELDLDNLLSQKPEYIPQLASAIDAFSSIDQSDRSKNLEDEKENESLDFQNFISSSEKLSKLCTTATRRLNKDDPKSPPEFYPASSTNISEMQKNVSITDNAITMLPSSSPLSAHKESTSSIYFSMEQQSSENEEKGEKRQENLAHEETTSSIYLNIEQQNSENVEVEEKRQELPAHKDRKSEISLSIDQQISENVEVEEKRQELPAHKDRISEKSLSIDQQNSEDVAKRERRRGSRFRRILSSCRRGLSRVARFFACCYCCPSTI